jgi:hypothetical protein
LSAALRHRQPRDVLAVQEDRAFGRRELPGHQVEIGGLAGAVRPDDGGQFVPARKAQLTRVDRHVPAEADGQVHGFQKHLVMAHRPIKEKGSGHRNWFGSKARPAFGAVLQVVAAEREPRCPSRQA